MTCTSAKTDCGQRDEWERKERREVISHKHKGRGCEVRRQKGCPRCVDASSELSKLSKMGDVELELSAS